MKIPSLSVEVRRLFHDSKHDFEPIGLTAHSPAVIVARKDFPADNLNEFVLYLK